MLESVITKVTDNPIIKAFLRLLELPINGHIPKNLVKTILPVKILVIKILIRFMF